jgi:SAM-dependent methyltransferase
MRRITSVPEDTVTPIMLRVGSGLPSMHGIHVGMDPAEIRTMAAVEDRHWWYKERRKLLARELRRFASPGRALDLGAAGGGNTRVMLASGWQAVALDYSLPGVEVARDRGIPAAQIDARHLPVSSESVDLVTAFDVLEHIDEDYLVTAEIARVLRPGGTALIAVPCDMALWSSHDEACGHVRRYTRESLSEVMLKADLAIDQIWSWNVLLRPVVAAHRKSLKGSDLGPVNPLVNAALTSIIVAERYLPVQSLPGVSLMLRARRR